MGLRCCRGGAIGTSVLRTSAYRLRIRTDSADDNALILLSDSQLVAIIVELADESHGDERGKWTVETIFGLANGRYPRNYASAGDAADWVSDHLGLRPFILGDNVELLS